jgi:nitroimidazol reductase NimA-like FMN-containing flavoprotein (pyridoxamine 5'-phosphate oxidase superfamily)
MIRALAGEEIERVLKAEAVGRIGCHVGDETYVVPVSYVYQDVCIYAHSAPGQKIEMMRQNPRVCFEVDHVEDLANWTSVICWGTYRELSGEEAERALARLRKRLTEVLPRVIDHGRLAAEEADGSEKPVVFCINVAEASGREERLHWELLPVANGSARTARTMSFRSTPAERWLSHERAQQMADMSSVLDAEDIWTAADKLAEDKPLEEVVASLTYLGAVPDMAERIVGFLIDLRENVRVVNGPASVSSGGAA